MRRSLGPTLLFLFACGGNDRPTEQRPKLPTVDEVRADLAGLAFDAFVERSFNHLLRRSPELVVELGLQEQIDAGTGFLDDLSEDSLAEGDAIESTILELLRAQDRATLSVPQQIAYDSYQWYLDDLVRDQQFADLVYRVTPSFNSIVGGIELFFSETHRLNSASDGEAYVKRLWDIERKLGQVGEALTRLEQKGIFTPRLLISISRENVHGIATADPKTTPFYLALENKLTADNKSELLDRALEAITASVQPAYTALDALLGRLEGEGPEGIGVGLLPGGAEYYAQTLRHHVTADVTADELNQLGMTELERIHGELEQRFAALGYPSGLPLSDQIAHVAQDGGHVPSDQVLATYEALITGAESRLDAAFDVRPSADVVVKGGPTGGYYIEPSLDGARPGAFYAAVTGNGEAKFAMPTLAYHEAVPGHHLQIGIAQDLMLPLFQRLTLFTGYAEGWALYAEWLAFDLGWYQDDRFGDIGRLQAEAFRAARLVVDTGIHARGMTFDQAVDFLISNVGYPRGAAQEQIIRYASWPGQATAYWTGRSKIRALRTDAEQRLGAQFDLKVFHRAVLLHGALPLGVLDQVVRAELRIN